MRLASPRRRLPAALALAFALLGPSANAADKFVFLTDWFAQAEHGGFYQAQALGLYRQAGLDVTLRMGGPQVNLMQLLAAGKADCIMGFDVQTMKAWEQGIQAVTVAAFAQKDPLVLIAHPDVQRIEDLKDRTLLIGQVGQVTYWPWLKATHGFSDAQVRPYTFNIQPFLADKRIAQQGYLTSEPYSIQKASGIKPKVFLLADQGWPPYAGSIVCMQKTVERRPQAITAFLKASAEGWKRYLQGDPKPANALIQRDNPNMADDVIAQSIELIKAHGIVLGGDAATQGIGTITDERMKRTFDMLARHKLIDPTKVDWRKTYTTALIRPVQVKP
jgi:NitT/TauT family transport system substrate-binding protein